MHKNNEINMLNQEIKSEFKEEKLVLGYGNSNSKIVIIGEAPGKKEVELEKPFVGAAGKYLDEFLEILDIDREDIYITNTVKYRPTKKSKKTGNKINRPPKKKEINKFLSYLYREINLIDPIMIVTLGNVPLRAVVKNDIKIGDNHGKLIKKKILNKMYNIYPLYHPAAIIYNRSLKENYIEDLERLKNIIRKEK